MDSDEYRAILSELDEFVEDDIGFDELTEFIVDVAVATRDRNDLSVAEAVRFVMDGYKTTSAEYYGQYGEDGPVKGSVRSSMK